MPACAGLRALYAQSAVLVRIFHVLGIFGKGVCIFSWLLPYIIY